MWQSFPKYVLGVRHILDFGKDGNLRKKGNSQPCVLFKHAHVLFKYSPKVYFFQHNADIMLSFEIRYMNFKENCQKQWPWLLHMVHRNNYISLTIQMHLTQSSIVIHHQYSIFLNHLKHQKVFFFLFQKSKESYSFG